MVITTLLNCIYALLDLKRVSVKPQDGAFGALRKMKRRGSLLRFLSLTFIFLVLALGFHLRVSKNRVFYHLRISSDPLRAPLDALFKQEGRDLINTASYSEIILRQDREGATENV